MKFEKYRFTEQSVFLLTMILCPLKLPAKIARANDTFRFQKIRGEFKHSSCLMCCVALEIPTDSQRF